MARTKRKQGLAAQHVRELVREQIERQLSQPPAASLASTTTTTPNSLFLVFAQDMDQAAINLAAMTSGSMSPTSSTWLHTRCVQLDFAAAPGFELEVAAESNFKSAASLGNVALPACTVPVTNLS